MNKFKEKISSLIAWRPFFYSVTLLKTPQKNLYKNSLFNIKIVRNQKKFDTIHLILFLVSLISQTNAFLSFLNFLFQPSN